MKGLLHSKRFRKNLQKWLFMYVGVLALLTTVVTYSKFLTQRSVAETSRTSRFNVSIKPVNCSTYINDGGRTCEANSGTGCRPTQVVSSCFEVDTSDLEVDSDLYLTFDPALKDSTRDDGFYSPNITDITDEDILIDIVGVDIISNNNATEIYPSISNGWTESKEQQGDLRLRLLKKVDSGKGNKWIIRVRMKKDNGSVNTFTQKVESTKLVKVGYTMIQVVD